MSETNEKSWDIVFVQLFDFPSPMAHSVQILATAAALARRSHRVFLHPRARTTDDASATLREHYGYPAPEGLVLDPIRWKHKGLAGLAFRRRLLKHLRSAGRLVFYARQRRQTLQLLALRKWLGVRTPVVYEMHNLEHVLAEERGDSERAAKILAEERRLIAGVDRVVAISQPLADDLTQRLKPEHPVTVIPDGVDLERFSGIGRARLEGSRVELVYAGGLYAHKGVDALVEALKHLPDRVALTIVGGNSPEDLERLQGLARSVPGAADRVRFLGQVPPQEIPEHLARADLIVIPAVDESRSARYTSPLKLFEAMATGAPLIVAPAPSLTSVLEDGRSAFVAASSSPENLARAVEAALAQPSRAVEIGRAAQAASSAYGWDERAARIEAVLGGLGAERRKARIAN